MMTRCTVLFFVAVSLPMHGHENPWGDVHPYISVEEGDFVVWFTNKARDPEAENYTKTTYLRAAISRDGTALHARRKVAKLPDECAGIEPDPFLSKRQGGLNWPLKWEEGLVDFGGYSETEGKLFLHMSEFSGNEKVTPLVIAAYSPDKKELIASARLGNSARIYDFAVASRIGVSGEFAYIAWIEKGKDKKLNGRESWDYERRHYQLVLSRWRVGTRDVRHLPIRRTLGANIHVDLKIHKGRLLIAWHEGFQLEHSTIGVHSVDLTKATFFPKVAYSSVPSIQRGRLDAKSASPNQPNKSE